MPSHRETQAAFRTALAGQDVPPGIAATGDLARRFSVYRNTVAHSLISALSQRFPAVRRIVGPAFFDATAAVFVAAHPPRTPMIHAYGAEFPDFLANFPPAATLSYLSDVARIEFLRGQAYHSADARPMTAVEVGAAFKASAESAMLSLHPSLHIVTSDVPAVSIWRMNQPGATSSAPTQRAEAALIFREYDDAVVLPVAPAAAAITRLIAQGTPLGLAAQVHDPDAIAQVLSDLMRHSLVVDVRHSP